jgi:hypothetical protein
MAPFYAAKSFHFLPGMVKDRISGSGVFTDEEIVAV